METRPGTAGSTLAAPAAGKRRGKRAERSRSRSPRGQEKGDGGAGALLALIAAGTHELREIGAPPTPGRGGNEAQVQLLMKGIGMLTLHEILTKHSSRVLGSMFAHWAVVRRAKVPRGGQDERELRDYKAELEKVYQNHKRSLDSKVARLVKIFAFQMLADIREKTMQYLFRMAAAMQRWQSTVIENRTQKKADRYVMSTKQQLLSSCQHQIDAKDQDLRRVLNIFAFHVLNEVKGFLVRIQTPNLHRYAKKKALVSR